MLKYVKRFIRFWFSPSHAVTQVFINTPDIVSNYTLINFPSFFSPSTAKTIQMEVSIYDKCRKPVYTEVHSLKPFETKQVSYTGDQFPSLGIFSVRLKKSGILNKEDALLGQLFPQFYAFYHSPGEESIGLVHPQSLLNPKLEGVAFSSNALLSQANVEKVAVYQINPTSKRQINEVTLKNSKGDEVEKFKYDFEPYSAIQKEHYLCEDISVSVDKTTAPNTKPILFLYLKDGTFTVVHS